MRATPILFLVFVSGCGARHRVASTPEPVQCETGDAVYYSDALAGHKTASGQTYDPSRFTAAHRRMPLGSRVRVFAGAREVVVRVNDRGPFRGGGVIDLSRSAAEELGIVPAGKVPVTVCPL